MITGEEWKEEADTKQPLDYAMAKRYAEAGTVFLFGESGGPILAGQVKKVSPNGQYVLMGPESGPQAAWCPIDKITVLDVLVPWKEKEAQKPIIKTNEDALAALLGIDPSLIAAMPPKKPRKGKDKQ